MADEKKRSEHLLSEDAIPKVEVPKTESSGMRQFRLPSVLAKPPREGLASDEEPAPEAARATGDKAAGKRRRRRPSTGRFRDRTLNWFKTGDALEGEEAIEGDYEPYSERVNWLAIGGALALLLVIAVTIIWLVS